MATSSTTQLPTRPAGLGAEAIMVIALSTFAIAGVIFVPLILAATGAISLLAMLAIQWGSFLCLAGLRWARLRTR